jgi:hypothetical protein
MLVGYPEDRYPLDNATERKHCWSPGGVCELHIGYPLDNPPERWVLLGIWSVMVGSGGLSKGYLRNNPPEKDFWFWWILVSSGQLKWVIQTTFWSSLRFLRISRGYLEPNSLEVQPKLYQTHQTRFFVPCAYDPLKGSYNS